MSKRTSIVVPKPAADPSLRQRAARLRDAAGRFIKRSSEERQPPASGLEQTGTLPRPATAPADAYSLQIGEEGAGRRMPPGSYVMVEPVPPTGAGLAVFHRKGETPQVWDLTHNFHPDDIVGYGPGIEKLVEVVQPTTGLRGRLPSSEYDKVHRVIGVYIPAEVAEKHRPLPPDLPLMHECPEGMGEQYADDARIYPLVRKGETVVFDPARREVRHGALCVMEWSNGTRSISQINQRSVGSATDAWWTDPINRPLNLEKWLHSDRSAPVPILYASDGPYQPEHLLRHIVGTVVGILVPGPRRPRSEDTEQRNRASAGAEVAAPIGGELPSRMATAATPSDLAAACDWATAREAFMDVSANTAGWSEEFWDAEYDRCGAVYQRAIAEPSATVNDIAAKARLVLADLNRFGVMGQNGTAMELCAVVLKEVIALAPTTRREALLVAAEPLPASSSAIGAAAEPVTRDLIDSYDAWLFYERRRLKAEKIGSGFDWDQPGFEDALEVALSYIPVRNGGARFHFNREVTDPPPSTRAALVLSTVGCDWRK